MPGIDAATLFRRALIVAALALGATVAQAQYDTTPTEPPIPTPNYPSDPSPDSLEPGGGEFIDATAGHAPRVQTAEGGRYEWIVIGPISEAEAVRAAILQSGGMVTRSGALDALDQSTQIAVFPNETARQAAQEAITRLAPGSSLSWHHLFQFAEARAPRVYAPTLIGDTGAGRCRLAGPITIGMIDGPVNVDHPALHGVDVTYETLVARGRIPGADHGTGVAVLMVGEDPTGALAGFARGARLYAISVFGQNEEEEEANVERIAEAIDRLVGQGVRLINLSLSGPPNAALGRAVAAAAARGAVLIAASGNDRRDHVAWPAAAPEVIAVTAIDAQRRRFRLANTGVEVEFSAPGVDVYTARARGAGYASGTSFAAPIVTALAARQMVRGSVSVDAVRAALRTGVETLGPGTRNTAFGWGLVRSGGC